MVITFIWPYFLTRIVRELSTFLLVHTLSSSMAKKNLWYSNDFHILFYDHGNMENHGVVWWEMAKPQRSVLFTENGGNWPMFPLLLFGQGMRRMEESSVFAIEGWFKRRIWLNHQPIYTSLMFHLRLCQIGFVWPSTFLFANDKTMQQATKKEDTTS